MRYIYVLLTLTIDIDFFWILRCTGR